MPRRFTRLAALGFVAFIPALMGADGGGCSPPPPNGSGGSSGSGGATGSCSAQDATFGVPPAGCEPSTSYRWDGFTCAFERSCREACRGTDCDALYADRASCLAEHASCPGYDCEHDPEGTLKSLLDQHRSCATDADCAIVDTTCCSRYANSGIFEHDYQFLLRQAQYCFMGETGMYGGCLVLCPTLAPPACVNGLCAAPPQAQ